MDLAKILAEEEAPAEGRCVECEDREAELRCETCDEGFCEGCSQLIHRTGKRRVHALVKMNQEEEEMDADVPDDLPDAPATDVATISNILARSRFIPLRLTPDERHLLRLLEAALAVSEYTDKIDILSYTSKAKRIVAQLKHICAILSGLMVAQDYKAGQSLLEDRDYAANAQFYRDMFEIGRRYKIMNPDRLRATYGKMMFMIQDSLIPEVKEAMGFDLFTPVLTVHDYLEQRGGLAMLEDPLVVQATMEIISEGRARSAVQTEIRSKERSIESLSRKYATDKLPRESLRQCLYSIGDNNAFLRANRDPVQRLRHLLFDHFQPDEGTELAIQAGLRGSRLSHSHSKQFAFVNQSLTLWALVMEHMFELYALVDADLLSRTCRYRLLDTGQGLNRVQACPHISRKMHALLHAAQRTCGGWVGSSAIHLGDINVPNALVFIDKYLQVPRILNPVCTAIARMPALGKDPYLSRYLEDAFGGVDALQRAFLTDFFRHAFDGSGADNNFSAGSCIDGRLTSAWNWCNEIHKKAYHRALLLTDFPGFDGEGFGV
ncbi:hypothetical protein PYCC9005_001305 [Savitreella phatthalungensis]